MEEKTETVSCNDKNCCIHGGIPCRGRSFTGVVTSARMHKTVTIEFGRLFYLPKFERYEKRKTKLKAHNPGCINAKEGDIVKVRETRPLSKTKNFVIVEKLGKERGFQERMEALAESKTKKAEEEAEAQA